MEKRRIGVRAIIYNDGKILAVKHKSKDGTPKDWWAIPGGGLDPGESLEDGLKREMEEELGVKVEPGRLLCVQQFISGRADCDEELELFFLVDNSDAFAAVDFTNTTHGLDELAACEFIDPTKATMKPGFLSEIDLKAYVETIQPVLVVDRFQENGPLI